MIRSLFGLLVANAAFFAAGAGLVRLFGWRLRTHPGLAYMSGIASVGVLSTLMLDGGARAALVAGADPLRAAGLRSGWSNRERPEAGRRKTTAPGGSARWAARRLSRRPVRAVPVPAAELLGRVGEVDDEGARDRPPRRTGHVVFANQAYQPLVLDYPMLIPGLEAMDFRFMGRLDTIVVHVQFWLLLVGFLVAAFELLRDRVPQTLLWPSLLLVGTAPALADNLTSAYGDAPVAFFFSLAAIGGLAVPGRGRTPRGLALGADRGRGGAATKPEGSPFVPGSSSPSRLQHACSGGSLVPVGRGRLGLICDRPWRIWISDHRHPLLDTDREGARPRLPRGAGRPGLAVGAKSLVEKSFAGDWLAIVPIALVGGLALLVWRRSRVSAGVRGGALAIVFLSLLWGYWVSRPSLHYLLSTSGEPDRDRAWSWSPGCSCRSSARSSCGQGREGRPSSLDLRLWLSSSREWPTDRAPTCSVSGPDAEDYLQRMVSNDVSAEVCDALLLTPKARVIAPLRGLAARAGRLPAPDRAGARRGRPRAAARMRFAAKVRDRARGAPSTIVFGAPTGSRTRGLRRASRRGARRPAEPTMGDDELEVLRIRAGDAALRPRDRRPRAAGRGRARRACGLVHEGLLPGPGADRAAALPRPREPRPARAHVGGHGAAGRTTRGSFEGKEVGRVTSAPATATGRRACLCSRGGARRRRAGRRGRQARPLD